ncbi:MAG: class I tRNA ligase family protein, partial [Alphaproteobacteria bacterium]
PPPGAPRPDPMGESATALRAVTHRTIDKFTSDIERLHMNRAVARLYELTNAIAAFVGASPVWDDRPGDRWVVREALESLIRLLAPMMPHLAEELWERLGHRVLLVDTAWPEADPLLLVEEEVTYAVQVNGKLRATIVAPVGTGEQNAIDAAKSHPTVAAAIAGRDVRRTVFVPNRLVNFVV